MEINSQKAWDFCLPIFALRYFTAAPTTAGFKREREREEKKRSELVKINAESYFRCLHESFFFHFYLLKLRLKFKGCVSDFLSPSRSSFVAKVTAHIFIHDFVESNKNSYIYSFSDEGSCSVCISLFFSIGKKSRFFFFVTIFFRPALVQCNFHLWYSTGQWMRKKLRSLNQCLREEGERESWYSWTNKEKFSCFGIFFFFLRSRSVIINF